MMGQAVQAPSSNAFDFVTPFSFSYSFTAVSQLAFGEAFDRVTERREC